MSGGLGRTRITHSTFLPPYPPLSSPVSGSFRFPPEPSYESISIWGGSSPTFHVYVRVTVPLVSKPRARPSSSKRPFSSSLTFVAISPAPALLRPHTPFDIKTLSYILTVKHTSTSQNRDVKHIGALCFNCSCSSLVSARTQASGSYIDAPRGVTACVATTSPHRGRTGAYAVFIAHTDRLPESRP